MPSLIDVLTKLAPADDAEVAAGYQRYAAALETVLSPAQLDTYAGMIEHSGAIRIFEDLSPADLAALAPEEAAVASMITTDQTATMENRRVAALLTQHGRDAVVPDFVPSNANADAPEFLPSAQEPEA